jgi:hypothetical protein
MNSYHDYASTITFMDDKTKKDVTMKSVSYPQDFPIVKSLLKTTVSASEVYRPDKIAYRLYENPLMSWVIDEVNGFYNGFSEYYINREIYYPSTDALDIMGIDYNYPVD